MTRRSLLIARLSATGAMAVTEVESKPRDKFALANENVKQLLLLPDTDKNGRIRISKQEWLKFMEARFNQRDKDGNGELDRKELLQTKLSVRQRSSANPAE
jgi:Ca2+-binding EF-hand superfamily protein